MPAFSINGGAMGTLARSLLISLAVAICIAAPAPLLADYEEYLEYYLHLIEKDPKEELPKEKILVKNDFLYCTGASIAAGTNNEAADLMKEGKFKEAMALLEKGLKHAPLFVPFRYNMGVCLIFENRLKEAMLNFDKACAMVPEFSRIYMQKGYIFQRWNKINSAIDEYRKAIKYNGKELNAFISIGDIFFERNQMEAAKKYYDAALEIDQSFPNGLLGNAKIYFKKEDYVKTTVLLKSIDLSIEYDKSLHYYWGESAFKMNDYKKAEEQYSLLLTFRNDKFFLTHSAFLIEHKLDIARRFIDK